MINLTRYFYSSRKTLTTTKPVRLGKPQQTTTPLQKALKTEVVQDSSQQISILDKKWNERPMNIIKSPHKLTEPELYRTLQKIVEMPESKMKSMIIEGGRNNIDEVFLLNLA